MRRRGRAQQVFGTAALIVVVLGIGALVMRSGRVRDSGQIVARTEDVPIDGRVADSGHSFFEPTPATWPTVADRASVLVTIGPVQPVRLGEQISHRSIRDGVEAGSVRLHIWDWSRSDLSRVLVVKQPRRGLLSPDAQILLSDSGEAIDLSTGAVRRHTGFDVEKEQRLSIIGFSLSGRYVAAMIHLRSVTERVQLVPPLYGTTHRWALRVVELATGRIVWEFPAAAAAGAAFTPDEASVVYSSPENMITRRDLKSGEIRQQYQPALEPHGAVGIAISPDGRQVAAAHYHGELFVWDLATGRTALHHRFLRPDGERDTFFQAKVLRFSPDSRRLAMASGNRLKVLDTATGEVLAQYGQPTTPVFAHLRWSDDGERITLVATSQVAEFADERSFPPRATADMLPRIYVWGWRGGELSLKKFAKGVEDEARR